MNREEFATKVQNLVNQAYLHDIDNKYYKGMMHEAEKLRYPITLAEFLGWEEGAEYRRGGNILKVEGNHLVDKRANGKFYDTNCSPAELIDLRKAEKVGHEKTYRIPLPNLIEIDGMQQYLTERDGHWFANSLTDNLKQEWTEDEFHSIPTAYLIYAKATGEDEHNAGHNIEVWRWIDE